MNESRSAQSYRIGVQIEILLPTAFRTPDGTRKLRLNAHSVNDAIAQIAIQYPTISTRLLTINQQLQPYVRAFINDSLAEDLDAQLVGGDVVTLVAAVAGG